MYDELKRMWTEAGVAKFKVQYYCGIFLTGLRKTIKNLTQVSQSPGRELNRDLPNKKATNYTTEVITS